ncbi:IS3 family transposase [Bacillus megaterium]|jgi:hypothetical protein|nr:IS3 family transposase [Priestia megaterium]
MKSEPFKQFESVEHFKKELKKCTYYKHRGIKTTLKGMSPVQYRTHALQVACQNNLSNFMGSLQNLRLFSDYSLLIFNG